MIFDTRSFFAEDTDLGSKVYARFAVEKSGRYQAEFAWSSYDRSVRIRTNGYSTSLVDAVSMAFHTQRLGYMDTVVVYLCPEFPAQYWDSIKRLTPTRSFNA